MEVTPVELALELKSDHPPMLIDVREPSELAVGKLPGVVEIPLGRLVSQYRELDPEADWVVICRSGIRSENAAQFLRSEGFTRVRNLVTGMKGWAQTVDPSIAVA